MVSTDNSFPGCKLPWVKQMNHSCVCSWTTCNRSLAL